ncbi:MAG: hypothetical protein A2Y12_02585 [Planctomycetes bacterium GWF2_42_9]|nr:MAG: hypothetical protein A2Y12_02585 [Planctomycetes bacterium GWF2_42_9]
MLLHDQKLEQILDLVRLQPYWTSIELATKLGISRSTVQKCLHELHHAGVVERIHGGVKRKDNQFSAPVPVDQRLSENSTAKEKICSEAIKHIPEQGYIYLDAGTTTLPLARMLNNRNSKLVVVTNDITIASTLAKCQVRHVLLGGQVHPVTQSISGSAAQNQIGDYQFEACFMSVDSISPQGKVCSAISEESMLKRRAIELADKRILLAACEKFIKTSGCIVCGLGEFDTWITEKTTPAISKLCKTSQVKLICA